MLSQTAWKIGRAFAHAKQSAPAEFAAVEREANSLSGALKLVAEILHEHGSILTQAKSDTKSAVNTILKSAHQTLDDLESFVDRYQVIRKKATGQGFVVERSWSEAVIANYKSLKWTTEGGNLIQLRNMLRMHTNCINQTVQALESGSLERLENTVMPMSENINTMRHQVNGDLGDKLEDLHKKIISLASMSTTSLVLQDKPNDSGSSLDSTERAPTLNKSSVRAQKIVEPPSRTSSFTATRQNGRLRDSQRRLTAYPPATARVRSDREDSAHRYSAGPASFEHGEEQRPMMDWDFETGSPEVGRGSIASGSDARLSDAQLAASPIDSAYDSWYSIESPRRESATLPALFKTVEDEYNAAAAGSSRDVQLPDSSPELSSERSPKSVKNAKSKRISWRAFSSPAFLPSPAIPAEDSSHVTSAATPSSVLSKLQRPQSNVYDWTQTAKPNTNSVHRQTIGSRPASSNEGAKFEKQLFRNAAILCDLRGKLVEYAHLHVKMVKACEEARVCVIRKRENKEHGGTKVVTSIWIMSDDGQVRLKQRLSETQETVPYCSYFEPMKVSLQADDYKQDLNIEFHAGEWGHMLSELKTNCVNYHFMSENDAVAFQSAIFGRTLMGSYRTTKTTVIQEGFKGTFAFEEQFANIEMLRVWEDAGVSAPGAAGGVLALMHISSNFGEGWARWWINSSKQLVRIKADGPKHAKVKGINLNVVKPGKSAARPERTRAASFGGEEGARVQAATRKNSSMRQVGGIRIEFNTEEERDKFVSMAKKCQDKLLPLPIL